MLRLELQMKAAVENIADISTGYLFRSKVQADPEGRLHVIQMKDVGDDGRIDWDGLVRVDLGPMRDSVLVRPRDILIGAKGSSHTAVLVDRDRPDVIASSHFFILRVRADGVLPEYLAWYLNQRPARQEIAQVSVGTWMRHITKKDIAGLPVPVPDLETQRRIVYVDTLARRQRQLVDAIQVKREALMNAVLLSAVKDRDKGA